MGQEFSQGSASWFFFSIWHGLKLISGLQVWYGLIWKVQDRITRMSGTMAGIAKTFDLAETVTRMPIHSLSSMTVSGYLNFLHRSSGLLKRPIQTLVAAESGSWCNLSSVILCLLDSPTESTIFMEKGYRFYLMMERVSKNLLPYLIFHKSPSGHKLCTFFSSAEYTHSSPKSPKDSGSPKSYHLIQV